LYELHLNSLWCTLHKIFTTSRPPAELPAVPAWAARLPAALQARG
jgi:hypothetical protein